MALLQAILSLTLVSSFWLNSQGFSIDLFPSDNLDEIRFKLYTRDNPQTHQIIDTDKSDSLRATNFIPNRPTKILIHGWDSSFETIFGSSVKKAYLNVSDLNLIAVDWSHPASDLYVLVRSKVTQVAEKVSKLVVYLLDNSASPNSIHIIGHSLGAHIAGVTGLLTHINFGIQLPRVTGLDPAGPLFRPNAHDRISPDSAAFVDVIHTCGNLLGDLYVFGHADFYPNGGVAHQPGCENDLDLGCSHRRSVEYFADSILHPGTFMALPCSNWRRYLKRQCFSSQFVEMGEYVPYGRSGVYYLATSKKYPFGLGSRYP